MKERSYILPRSPNRCSEIQAVSIECWSHIHARLPQTFGCPKPGLKHEGFYNPGNMHVELYSDIGIGMWDELPRRATWSIMHQHHVARSKGRSSIKAGLGLTMDPMQMSKDRTAGHMQKIPMRAGRGQEETARASEFFLDTTDIIFPDEVRGSTFWA